MRTAKVELINIKDNILSPSLYEIKKDTIFFYDGFGLDLRGWAASYVRAITKLGYHLVYMCPDSMKNKIPHILSEMSDKGIALFLTINQIILKGQNLLILFLKNLNQTQLFYILHLMMLVELLYSLITNLAQGFSLI